jgi:predicted nucleic acid-binding Zn ribbon protein
MLSYEESKANKFCSHNCSAKFNNSKRAPRTIESRNKTSESLKGRKHTSSITQQKILKYKPITNCIICSKPTGNHTRVTCSLDCRKIHATNNALNRPCSQGGRGYKGKYKGISLDSTWELAYLIYHLDHNIDICRSTNIYEYVFNDHTYKYKPDFIVNGQEIEIKGYMSDRSKAKMSQNLNIIVIDKLSINFYINYVKGKYNTKNLKDLYD